MARIRRFAQHHRLTLLKTASYYVLHITVAATVAYLITGNLWAALTLSLVEPTVQAVAFFFHERAWARHLSRQPEPPPQYPSANPVLRRGSLAP